MQLTLKFCRDPKTLPKYLTQGQQKRLSGYLFCGYQYRHKFSKKLETGSVLVNLVSSQADIDRKRQLSIGRVHSIEMVLNKYGDINRFWECTTTSTEKFNAN